LKVKLALTNGQNDAAAGLALEEAEKCGLGEDPAVFKLRKMLTDMMPCSNYETKPSWFNKASFHYD
jgi:hypothetical protein